MWYRLVHKYSKLNHCSFPWYCAKRHTFNLHEMPCWLSYSYITKKHKRGCPSHAARLIMSFNAGPSSFHSYPPPLGLIRLQEFLRNTNEAITCPWLLGGRKLWISQNFMLERKAQQLPCHFQGSSVSKSLPYWQNLLSCRAFYRIEPSKTIAKKAKN